MVAAVLLGVVGSPSARALSPQDTALPGAAADEFQITPPPALDEASFAQLHAALIPDAPSVFESIPWRIDLEAARQEAVRMGRPLFLWSMNGHPLGCT